MTNTNTGNINDWVVTYDQNGMPESISGFIDVATQKKEPTTRPVKIVVFALNLRNKTATDYAGNQYTLSGPGKQALYFQQTEPFDFIQMVDTEDEDPDPDLDDG